MGDLNAALRGLSLKLLVWNRNVFGSIFRRKWRVKNRLKGVKAVEDAPTLSMIKLERKLKRERIEVLLQEETLWMQKSRIDWL